jgi:2-polyprenyl-3-methyl-5-hydroxy-6-metoxy-1,4-benzoquinol methylase
MAGGEQEEVPMELQEDKTATNPYREAFYNRQAEWHGYQDAESAENMHNKRIKYYKWYTKEWLPEPRSTPVLDIGCGSGQFLYFLREQGYRDASGIDLDRSQVEIGRALGLDTRHANAIEFLNEDDKQYGLVSMLDILEHFKMHELFALLEAVTARLSPGGRIIASVPNGDSPHATRAIYADITHEIAFTPTSLSELFFCHGLRVTAFRDPWPAPVSPLHRVYRTLSVFMRRLEAFRLRTLGFEAPRYWSSVIWVIAEKPSTPTDATREVISQPQRGDRR